MNEAQFASIVRNAYADAPPVPEKHPLRTAACPPLTRFPAGVTEGWTTEERSHTQACAYCQKVTAMVWKEQPPRWDVLASYTADPEHCPDLRAFQIYIGGRGHRYYGLVRQFVEASSIRGLLRKTSKAALEHTAGFFAPLPVPETALATATENASSFELAKTFPDLGISITLTNTPTGNLTVFLSADRRHGGRNVQVTVFGSGEPLQASVNLAVGENGAHGGHVFGPAAPLLNRLGLDCLVTALFADE